MTYSIHKLSFAYPGKEALFTDLSLEFDLTRTTILAGENGSGKSSLLRLMAGLLRPQSGSITLRDLAISTLKPNPGVCYFPQNPLEGVIGINPKDDLMIWQMAQAVLVDSAAIQSIANKHASIWEQPWFRMSSGQQRRLALAVLPFLMDAYWLLDEPFAGLDLDAEADLMKIIQAKQSSRNPGILIVSHDSGLATRLHAKHLNLDELK